MNKKILFFLMFVFYCINLTFAGSTIFNGIYINSTIETGNSLIEPPEFEEKTILSFYAVSNNLSTNNITYGVKHSSTTNQGFYLKMFRTFGYESSKVCEGSSQTGDVSTCSFIYTDAMLKDEQYYAILCSDHGDCTSKEVDLSFRDEGEFIPFGTYIKFGSESGNDIVEPLEYDRKDILSFYAVSNNLSTNNITYAVRHSPTTSQGFYLKIFQTLGSESSKVCEGSSQMGEVSTCSFIYTDAMLKDEQYYAVLCSDRGDCSGKEVDLSFRDEGELIHFGTYIKFASAKVAVVNAVESNSTNNASSSLFPSSNLKSVLFSIGAIFFFLLF